MKFRKNGIVKKSLIKNSVLFVCLLFAMLCPPVSFAAVTMLVTPNGDGSFFLVGDNVTGVSAIDISIDYDSIFLSNPSVDVSGGVLTDVYAGTPGKLLVSVSRENPDAAFFLTLNFEKRGDSPGGINRVTTSVRDTEGKISPVQDAAITPPNDQQPAGAEGRSSEEGRTASAADGTNEAHRCGDDCQGTSGTASHAGLGTDTASDVAAATDPEQSAADARTLGFDDREKSVLRRFMEFKGRKELKAFSALFERNIRDRSEQKPAIAISDGKTPVVIRLTPQLGGNDSPDIALSNATLVSLHKDGGKNWIVTAIPREGACEAKLIFKVGREVIEFPLVVAPRVTLTDGINEKNFLDALNEYLVDQAVAHKGENVPHLNDYIFTANYLANRPDFPSKKGPR